MEEQPVLDHFVKIMLYAWLVKNCASPAVCFGMQKSRSPLYCTIYVASLIQRTNSWTYLGEKSYEFHPWYSVTSTNRFILHCTAVPRLSSPFLSYAVFKCVPKCLHKNTGVPYLVLRLIKFCKLFALWFTNSQDKWIRQKSWYSLMFMFTCDSTYAT